MNVSNIIDNSALDISHYRRVHGGDINQAYCLFGSQGKYFLKVNNAKKYPRMFEKEANGLAELNKNCTLIVPQIIQTGIVENEQYLVLEWLEQGNPRKKNWGDFGAALASMHQANQPFFGWKEGNFIGTLYQNNKPSTLWHIFFEECRIMPLVKMLFDNQYFSKNDIQSAGFFCNKIQEIFPEEPPSLLHGDLWSGNFLTIGTGEVALIDPAVYYGHREMDIGMTKLFGGFDGEFYDRYNDTYPLRKGWQSRLPFAQIYPLLVHAVLFGGHYVERTREILKTFRTN